MKNIGEQSIVTHAVLTLVLDDGESLTACPIRFSYGTQYGPQDRSVHEVTVGLERVDSTNMNLVCGQCMSVQW